MNYSFLSNTPNGLKLVFTICVMIICLFAFVLIAAFIAMPIFGMSLTTVLSSISIISPENVSFLKYFQTVQTIGLFIIPAMVVVYFEGLGLKQGLGFSGKISLETILFAILIIVCLIPLINWLTFINAGMKLPHFLSGVEQWMKQSEQLADKVTKLFLITNSSGVWLVNLLVMALLPALGEEMLFRGLIQRYMIGLTRNTHAAIWITACIFSAFHLQFYGFIPRLLLGALLGYLFVWSGNLWVPVLVHFINNALGVSIYYFAPAMASSNDLDHFGTSGDTCIYTFLSAIIVALLLWYMRKQLLKKSWHFNKGKV